MHIFQEADNGLYEGILKGFEKATGDIIAYINSDDFYLPNAFSCVCVVERTNLCLQTLVTLTIKKKISVNACKAFIHTMIF